jgi:outer membrane murein-binding lipoprotein Lpp
MEGSGKAIHTVGGEFSTSVNRLRAQLESLIPYFGNPESDEAAHIFRRGMDGHPGFDSAYEDLSTAVHNLGEAYKQIGSAVEAMSKNVEAADWASMVDRNEVVKELVEFAQRENDQISVPTTPVELA